MARGRVAPSPVGGDVRTKKCRENWLLHPYIPTMQQVILVEDEDTPKTRACLKCRQQFQSAWAGERVCGRCKNSEAWRSGHGTLTRSKPGPRQTG